MKELCIRSLRFLESVYSPERALFPYSTRVANGAYVSEYEHPLAMRYTINSLLGIARACECLPADPFARRASALIEQFLARHLGHIERPSDAGLLLVLLSQWSDPAPARGLLHRVREVAESSPNADLTMQDLAWMLWGAIGVMRAGMESAEETARLLFKRIHADFLCRDSLIPRHNLSPIRRGIVSFGAVTYYLRAMAEYADAFGDEYALELFRNGVERIMAMQGPQGEWPWMIGVARARCLDFYPVYSVHQDAMAMLFLFPAMDAGVAGARHAIRRSIDWIAGKNQLAQPMFDENPFIIWREIRRKQTFEKARRFARASWNLMTGAQTNLAPSSAVEINPECRSYHLGWLLYAWAGRDDFPLTPANANKKHSAAQSRET